MPSIILGAHLRLSRQRHGRGKRAHLWLSCTTVTTLYTSIYLPC